MNKVSFFGLVNLFFILLWNSATIGMGMYKIVKTTDGLRCHASMVSKDNTDSLWGREQLVASFTMSHQYCFTKDHKQHCVVIEEEGKEVVVCKACGGKHGEKICSGGRKALIYYKPDFAQNIFNLFFTVKNGDNSTAWDSKLHSNKRDQDLLQLPTTSVSVESEEVFKKGIDTFVQNIISLSKGGRGEGQFFHTSLFIEDFNSDREGLFYNSLLHPCFSNVGVRFKELYTPIKKAFIANKNIGQSTSANPDNKAGIPAAHNSRYYIGNNKFTYFLAAAFLGYGVISYWCGANGLFGKLYGNFARVQ